MNLAKTILYRVQFHAAPMLHSFSKRMSKNFSDIKSIYVPDVYCC